MCSVATEIFRVIFLPIIFLKIKGYEYKLYTRADNCRKLAQRYRKTNCLSSLMDKWKKVWASLLIELEKYSLWGETSQAYWWGVWGGTVKLGLVDNPGCGRWKTGIWNGLLHSLWLWGTGHINICVPGSAFLKPGNFGGMSVSRVLYFVQSAGLLNVWAKGLHKR
jgi:hypothetical protein